jgi:hypothetical protein
MTLTKKTQILQTKILPKITWRTTTWIKKVKKTSKNMDPIVASTRKESKILKMKMKCVSTKTWISNSISSPTCKVPPFRPEKLHITATSLIFLADRPEEIIKLKVFKVFLTKETIQKIMTMKNFFIKWTWKTLKEMKKC